MTTVTKVVDGNWVWFEDYYNLKTTYYIATEPGRTVEAGTGVSVGGEPQGSRVKIKDTGKASGWGIGSLHIRVTDGGPPCNVSVGFSAGLAVPPKHGPGITFPLADTTDLSKALNQQQLEALNSINAALEAAGKETV